MRFFVCVLTVVARIAYAHAETSVGVVVVGEPTKQTTVSSHLKGWLKQHGYAVVAAPFDPEATTTFANCFVIEDMPCARGAFEKNSHAATVVFARVDLQAKGTLALTLYWFVKDHDATADKETCKRCDDKQLRTTIDVALKSLAKTSGLGKGRLILTSQPDGVIVMLDGVDVGVTPIERDLEPGSHQIVLMKGGQQVGTKAVTIERDSTAELTIPVVIPKEVAPKPITIERTKVVEHTKVVVVEKPAPPSRVLPGLIMFAGLATAAGGGVSLYYGHKSGPNEPWLYPTATRNGEILLGAGGVLLVAGTIWFIARSGSQETPPTAPAVSVVPGGATFGWAGVF
jgi:hypothetical protein